MPKRGAEPIFCDRESVGPWGVEIVSRPVSTVENGLVRHNPGHLAWELVQLHNQRELSAWSPRSPTVPPTTKWKNKGDSIHAVLCL